MAEAHAAVAFSFTVTHDGVDVNVDRDALKAVWHSGVRTWKRKVARFMNSVHNGMYPARPSSWFYIVGILLAISLCGKDPSWGVISRLEVYFRTRRNYQPPYDHAVASLVFSILLWLFGIGLIKYFLLMMLQYNGWMFEQRGRPSKRTLVWLGIMRLLRTRTYRLYGYQGSLPRLPLPSVKATVARFLRSVEPYMMRENYTRMEALARQFQATVATKLQFYLFLKSWWSSNYVSDWWEDYVYLAGRSPIMVNSNYYGIDAILTRTTTVQAARAANVTYLMLQFMRQVDREELKPILLNNTVPLCSWQYERIFSTTRIPGVEKDTIAHYRDSRHVVVIHNGRYFKLYFYSAGRWLTPCELQVLFQAVLDNKSEPVFGEETLAAITAGDRVPWARARQQHFARGTNKVSLDAIEKAAIVVVLDDEELDYEPADPSRLDAYATAMLAGKCHNRWFDKSFTLVFTRNGRMGFNAEHSWGDAPIMSHVWEFTISYDLNPQNWKQKNVLIGYDEDGNCRGEPRDNLPAISRLKWDISPELDEVVKQSLATARALRDDVDLHLIVHRQFGKGLMKKCSVSPDAFVQIALQLAYYRNQGNFCLTYEASMTRMYREGRTETVRSCSKDSSDFARAMDDPSKTKEERLQMMRRAANTHTQLTRESMSGRGIDRHLFCLYVVSKYLNVESPFLREVLAEPWRLSTSQTPHQQTDLMDVQAQPTHLCAGGGFGPVADDGYGVSYIIAGENCVFFHISCKRSCPNTNSTEFGNAIVQAMEDLKNLV